MQRGKIASPSKEHTMNRKRILLILTVLILGSLLSACSGGIAASSWPGLTVDGDTAYLAYGNQVHAVDISNGRPRWLFPQEVDNGLSFYNDPQLTEDGQLVLGAYNHVLFSLNPDTGQSNWQFAGARNRYIASPLTGGGAIYAPNADKFLYAVDLAGNLIWRVETDGEGWAKPVTDPGCDCIYMPSLDHKIYAFDAATGGLLWESGDLGGSVVGTPAYSEGILYVGSFNSEMLAIDSQDGSVIWRTPVEGWVWSGPQLVDGMLYFGDLNGNFYKIDASNGDEVWRITSAEMDGPITGSPLVQDGSIYIPTESGTLFAYDTEATPLWSQTVGGKLHTSPVAAGDAILVAPIDADALLVALTNEGAIRWSYTTAEQ